MNGAFDLPGISADRARALVDGFTRARVVVVGDVMLDRFLVGRVDRISPEAPVPIVAFDHEEDRIGGAGNVAHNVAALGGRAELAAVTGVDEARTRLVEALAARGIGTAGLIADGERRTTTKVRVVTTRNQQVARIDYETDTECAGATEEALVERALELASASDAIVVSDYLKGAITRTLMSRLVELDGVRAGRVPLIVDPKIPHLAYYAGATVIKPNHHEAEVATHRRIRTPEDARAAARAFRDVAGCRGVLFTFGEHGAWLLDDRYEGHLPATAREVADVTGAGDTVVATLALALAAGATSAEAAHLATHAAGIVVGRFGPATIAADELVQAVHGSPHP